MQVGSLGVCWQIATIAAPPPRGDPATGASRRTHTVRVRAGAVAPEGADGGAADGMRGGGATRSESGPGESGGRELELVADPVGRLRPGRARAEIVRVRFGDVDCGGGAGGGNGRDGRGEAAAEGVLLAPLCCDALAHAVGEGSRGGEAKKRKRGEGGEGGGGGGGEGGGGGGGGGGTSADDVLDVDRALLCAQLTLRSRSLFQTLSRQALSRARSAPGGVLEVAPRRLLLRCDAAPAHCVCVSLDTVDAGEHAPPALSAFDAALFEPGLCLQQLRCSGVFEATAITKLGYPFRYSHAQFANIYRWISRKANGWTYAARSRFTHSTSRSAQSPTRSEAQTLATSRLAI